MLSTSGISPSLREGRSPSDGEGPLRAREPDSPRGRVAAWRRLMSRRTTRSGRIVFPDRLQRLVIGGVLMALTVCGLMDGFGWKKAIALLLQIELLLTAMAGWCPFYWACRIRSRET